VTLPRWVGSRGVSVSCVPTFDPGCAQVWTKLRKVVVPSSDTKDELRNWDLWGPLFLCLLLAVLLSIDESGLPASKDHDRPAVVFSTLLLIVWVGSVVVTVNAKLLGGSVSFFQNICLLGYCTAPLILATGLCMFIRVTLPDQYHSCGPGPKTLCNGGVCTDPANITVNVGAQCQVRRPAAAGGTSFAPTCTLLAPSGWRRR
jgi:hypothetical protein